MAGITLAQAEAKLSTWMDADDAVATGQAYEMPGPAGRKLTRADADIITDKIRFWNNMVKALSSVRTGIRATPGTPL